MRDERAAITADDEVLFLTEWRGIYRAGDLYHARFKVGTLSVAVVLTEETIREGVMHAVAAMLKGAPRAPADNSIVALIPPF